MKKIILSLIAIFAFTFAHAQYTGVKFGVNLGAPLGDAKDISSITLGADFAYLYDITEEFHLGASIGYLTFVGKKYHGVKRDNLGFIPIAATAQYSIVENIFIGADLGYAIGISPSELDGGFYYLPKVGYQIDLFEVYVGYKGITSKVDSESYTLSAITLGFNYKF